MTRLTANHLVRPPESDYRKTLRAAAKPLDPDLLLVAQKAKTLVIGEFAPKGLREEFADIGSNELPPYFRSKGVYLNIDHDMAGPIFGVHKQGEDPEIVVYSGLNPNNTAQVRIVPSHMSHSTHIAVNTTGTVEEAAVLVDVFRYGNPQAMASLVLSPEELSRGFDSSVIRQRIEMLSADHVTPDNISKFLRDTGFSLDMSSLLRILAVRLFLKSLPSIDDPVEQTRVLANSLATSGVVFSNRFVRESAEFDRRASAIASSLYDIASGNVLYRMPKEIMQFLGNQMSLLSDVVALRAVLLVQGSIIGASSTAFASFATDAEKLVTSNARKYLGFVPKSPEVPELITKEDFPSMLGIWRM